MTTTRYTVEEEVIWINAYPYLIYKIIIGGARIKLRLTYF